jgi:hypothetical protein
MLQVGEAETTKDAMAKTEQVRIPIELGRDGRLVAAALGVPFTQYVEDVLRQAIKRDLPKVKTFLDKRMKETDGKDN